MHAVSRDAEAFAKPCVYLQLDEGSQDGGMGGGGEVSRRLPRADFGSSYTHTHTDAAWCCARAPLHSRSSHPSTPQRARVHTWHAHGARAGDADEGEDEEQEEDAAELRLIPANDGEGVCCLAPVVGRMP
jgi:hypothetical protein